MDIQSLFPASFLKAADLQGQPRTVTIESCAPEQIGDSETKPVLRLVGIPKGLVLNRTNATVIAAQPITHIFVMTDQATYKLLVLRSGTSMESRFLGFRASRNPLFCID